MAVAPAMLFHFATVYRVSYRERASARSLASCSFSNASCSSLTYVPPLIACSDDIVEVFIYRRALEISCVRVGTSYLFSPSESNRLFPAYETSVNPFHSAKIILSMQEARFDSQVSISSVPRIFRCFWQSNDSYAPSCPEDVGED